MNRPLRHAAWIVLGAAVCAAIVFLSHRPRPAVAWEPYSPEKLAVARAAGRPVILDFCAVWCEPCHKLETQTYVDPAVIQALQRFVRLKVDLTQYDSPESRGLREQFKIEGLPTVIRLGPDGREVPDTRILGFVPAEVFLVQMKLSPGAIRQMQP